ncbi:MAG: HAD domain-containing protein [Gallionella sp.]|nr:HAD domain-containing protein [Gallionella sp.]
MIVFLDFDGVLHPELPDRADDFACRSHFWQILRACPHVDVVFSTSWRELHPVHELIDFATQGGGEDLAHRFMGSTPCIPQEPVGSRIEQYYCRESECRLWLADNGREESSWLAIDDFSAYFSPSCPSLYVVDHTTGLTELDAERLIERLKK